MVITSRQWQMLQFGCYVYIVAVLPYLTTVNQCLTIYFSSKSYMSLKRSPLDEAKKKAWNHWKSKSVKNANG